jgi:hypothetical protein
LAHARREASNTTKYRRANGTKSLRGELHFPACGEVRPFYRPSGELIIIMNTLPDEVLLIDRDGNRIWRLILGTGASLL